MRQGYESLEVYGMENDERYKVYLECIESPVLVLDNELQIEYCNDAFVRLAGQPNDELEGNVLLDVMPDLIGTDSHRAYLQVLSTNSSATSECRIANRYYAERIYPTEQGLLSIFDDISETKRFEAVVQALANHYHDVFDEIWDAVIIQDTYTTDIQEVNKSACNMFGYSRDEMIKMNMGELCADEAPFTSEEFKRWLRMAPREGPNSMEWKARDCNGHEFWIDVRCRRLMVGNELRLVSVIRDITTVKTANDELRHSRKEFDGFFKNASDMIFVTDLGGNFVSVNPAAERITGYQAGQLERMNIQELADEETLQLLRGFQYQRLANGRFVTYEAGFITQTGNHIYLDVNIWPIYKAGKPVAVQGIGRNITKMKEQLKLLSKAEKSLKGLIQFLPDATLAINTEGRVVAWNQAMEELTGVSAEEMLGKGDYEYSLAFYDTKRPIMVDLILNPEGVEKYYQVLEVDKFTVISEFATPNLRGRGRYLWGRAMRWYDEDGTLLGAIECLRDITDRYNYTQSIKDILQISETKALQLETILDGTGQNIVLADKNGQISYASQRFYKLLGYKRSELIGKALADLLASEDKDKAEFFVSGGEEPVVYEVALMRNKGTSVSSSLEIRTLPTGGFLISVKKHGRPKKRAQE